MQIFQIRWLITIYAIIGSLYVFLIPPFQPPDENSHFLRLISISRGNIYPESINGQYGHMLPESLNNFIAKHLIINGKTDEKYGYADWYADSHAQIPVEEKLVFSGFSASGFSPIYYLPQFVGLSVGRLLYFTAENYNWQSKLYFARLGALLFTVLTGFLVLYLAPSMQFTLLSILFMPMSLAMSSAISADPILNCASIIWLACILRLKSGKGITPIVALAVYFSVFIISHVKVVYAPLLLLIWLVKPSLLKSDFSLLIKGILLSSFIGLSLSFIVFPQHTPVELALSTKAQGEFLFNHPVAALLIPFKTLFEYKQFYFISLFANFGSLDTNLPFSIVVLMAFSFFVIAILERLNSFEKILSINDLLILAAVVFLVIIGIFDATYMIWTSHTKGVGVPFVDGVQGRYFIPLLPYLMLFFYAIPVNIKNSAALNIFIYEVFFNVISLIAVLLRFWIN